MPNLLLAQATSPQAAVTALYVQYSGRWTVFIGLASTRVVVMVVLVEVVVVVVVEVVVAAAAGGGGCACVSVVCDLW